MGIVTNATVPAVSTTAPHWGGTGTTNYATNQVTPGGNYATGGPSLTSLAYTNSAGTVSWQAAKVAIAQNASNPTNARWGIIYNNTDTNKRAAAYVDLGSARDLTQGLFEIRWNSVDGTGTIGTLA
jgi:hypothetical protein